MELNELAFVTLFERLPSEDLASLGCVNKLVSTLLTNRKKQPYFWKRRCEIYIY